MEALGTVSEFFSFISSILKSFIEFIKGLFVKDTTTETEAVSE